VTTGFAANCWIIHKQTPSEQHLPITDQKNRKGAATNIQVFEKSNER
jgi:hypothetical protein